MQVELPLECIPQVMNTQTDIFPQQLAIHLRDVNLVYSKKNVLSGLSLSVPRGSMYGLLGPSGCGKTVLIRCILGTAKPTSGSIEVSGHKPGKSHSVGYMPQHIALFPQLTIRETFNYFGSIYGLDGEQVNEQCQSLIESLHLPTQTDQLVGLLSGDQKRRLSLAIALIHKPKLLILDEPTRGMDPLIRNFIWGHLGELSLTDQLTVLITSDCIEEVKNYANLIGLMRHGHILAQDSPSALLDRFQMNPLEQEFLYLSAEEDAAIVNEIPNVDQVGTLKESQKSSSCRVESVPEVVVEVENKELQQQPTEPMDECQMDSVTDIPIVSKCTQTVAMVTKNIRTLYRNKSKLMIFQLSLPTVLVALFCLYIALPKHPIPVAVYDGDINNSSLSDKLIYTLDPVIINQQYPSWDEVFEAFRMSKAPSALAIEVHFPSCTFKHKLLDYIGSGFTYSYYPISSTSGRYTCPMTLTSVYKDMIRRFPVPIKKYWVIHPKFKQVPVLIEKPDRSSSSLTPGMISSISFFCAIPLTSITLLTEKKNGVIERTLVSGVSYFHILLSHLIPQTVILFLQMMSLVLIAFPLFGILFHFQYLLALSHLSLQSVCGMCFGLFVSTIARDGNIAIMLVLGLFYLNLMLSGAVFSIGVMIDYVNYGYLFEVICAFSLTLILSGIFLLAATLMARFCL